MCKNKSAPRLVKSDALLKNNGMVLHPNDLESQGHLERIVCPSLWGSAEVHETRVGCFIAYRTQRHNNLANVVDGCR
jgi:hypothetical protein